MSAAVCADPAVLLDDLCRKLSTQRDALNSQLQVLRSVVLRPQGLVPADLALTLYLLFPSAKHVADFVNQQGLRVAGATGPRALLPCDVLALVRGECGAIDPCADVALADAAREKLRRRGGWMLAS